MKVLYRFLLFYFCLHPFCNHYTFAQHQNQPSINSKIDSLETELRKITEKHQNQEKMMDLLIEKKVWEELSNTLSTWGAILAGALAVLGFFGFRGIDSLIRSRVDEIIEKKVRGISTTKTPKTNSSSRGEVMNREQTLSLMELQLNEIKDKLALDKNYDQALEKAKTNFDKLVQIGDKALAAKYLDIMSSCYFYLRKDTENETLINRYENDYEFSYLSYANMAIASYDKYELNGGNAIREKALKYADKALQKLPNYGTAQAIKLLVYMIDYKNMNDQNLKEQSKTNAKNVLSEILFGNNMVSSYETYNYFHRIISNPQSPFNQYINILTQLFPTEWAELKRRDQAYINSLMGNVLNHPHPPTH